MRVRSGSAPVRDARGRVVGDLIATWPDNRTDVPRRSRREPRARAPPTTCRDASAGRPRDRRDAATPKDPIRTYLDRSPGPADRRRRARPALPRDRRRRAGRGRQPLRGFVASRGRRAGPPRAYPSGGARCGPGLDAVLVGAWPAFHARPPPPRSRPASTSPTEARMAPAPRMPGRCPRRPRPPRTDRVVVRAALLGLGGRHDRPPLLREGAIGRVRHVQVTWDSSAPGDPGDFWSWQRSTSGENVMALGILAESMARWLGQPRRSPPLPASTPRNSRSRPAPSRPTSPTTSWRSSSIPTT